MNKQVLKIRFEGFSNAAPARTKPFFKLLEKSYEIWDGIFLGADYAIRRMPFYGMAAKAKGLFDKLTHRH